MNNENLNALPVTAQLSDSPQEECGVFGVWAPGQDVARITYLGLHALQHRGQESAGIAVGDEETVLIRKDLGLVTQVFSDSDIASLLGNVAIGHVRNALGAKQGWNFAQPYLSTIDDVLIALAYNGEIVNPNELRSHLINHKMTFMGNSDSELLAKLIGYYTRQYNHLRKGIQKTMEVAHGAYAMVLINNEALYAFRDAHGIRPLVIGKLPDDEGWVVASETCALDIVGATFIRDVAPGEIIKISEDGIESSVGLKSTMRNLCIFEHVYFARPDSVIEGDCVYTARVKMGEKLAEEAPADADLVIGVPDSGLPPAVGYSQKSGIPFGEGIVKNRYIGRTFIEPTQKQRERGVRLKLNPLTSVIKGKRLVVVDDSIVRGTTSKQIVKFLYDAGAKEVHLRIVSPETAWPCFYGVDTNRQSDLISARMDVEGVKNHVGADSLAFLTLEGLRSCVSSEYGGYCDACFSGEYPICIPKNHAKGNFLKNCVPKINGMDS